MRIPSWVRNLALISERIERNISYFFSKIYTCFILWNKWLNFFFFTELLFISYRRRRWQINYLLKLVLYFVMEMHFMCVLQGLFVRINTLIFTVLKMLFNYKKPNNLSKSLTVVKYLVLVYDYKTLSQGSIPGLSTWELWQINWYRHRFSLHYCYFSLSASLHQCFVLIHSYITDTIQSHKSRTSLTFRNLASYI